ncbi:MAG: nuclear transport factor 2 family protein, partial [Ignavibacteria bacterium]|nr:nuclear transport factor 2 family protein [Ignavibacteria bacterium]
AIKSQIDSIITTWHKAASEADFVTYMGMMDSVSIYIGTDATENWNKNQFEAFSKPYFDKGKAWDFKKLERNIYLSKNGETVWFDELLDTHMGTCRGSGVVELNGTDWKIKHYVLSIAIPNDAIDAVKEVKHELDSLFQQKISQLNED